MLILEKQCKKHWKLDGVVIYSVIKFAWCTFSYDIYIFSNDIILLNGFSLAANRYIFTALYAIILRVKELRKH